MGRATYDSSQEIRNDEITRQEGIRLVNQFDGEYPTRLKMNFWYLSMDQNFSRAHKLFENPIIIKYL